jgi:adenosine deaminase
MIDSGLLVCINSDDPAYFGGYVGDNYRAVQTALGFDAEVMTGLAKNSIISSFLDETRKQVLLDELAAVSAGNQGQLPGQGHQPP